MDAKVYKITYMLNDWWSDDETPVTEEIEAHGFHMDGNYVFFWGEDYSNHTVRRDIAKIDRIK